MSTVGLSKVYRRFLFSPPTRVRLGHWGVDAVYSSELGNLGQTVEDLLYQVEYCP